MLNSTSGGPVDGHGSAEMLDALTELPNRETFCRRLDDWRSTQTSKSAASVLYLDLDRFKSVNSLHGRFVGDQALKWVAQRFQSSVGDAALVGRVGGDEFACLWNKPADIPHLTHVADEMLRTLAKPARIGALDITVAPSIGIVLDAAVLANAASILHRAALTMYRARHSKLGYAFDGHAGWSPSRPLFEFGGFSGGV